MRNIGDSKCDKGNLLRQSFILDSESSDIQKKATKMVKVFGVVQTRGRKEALAFNNNYDKKIRDWIITELNITTGIVRYC